MAGEQVSEFNGVLDASEQKLFDEMRNAPEPVSSPEPAPVETVPAPAGTEPAPAAGADLAAAAAAAAAGEDHDDDDHDDVPAAGAEQGAQPPLGADGKPIPRRVSRAKHQRVVSELQKKLEETASALAKSNEDRARLDERTRLIQEALAAPAQEAQAAAAAAADADPEPPVDANGDPVDIFEHYKWERRQRAKLEQGLNEVRNGRQADQGEQQLATAYVQDANNFAQREPNFVPAYSHLMAVRTAQLARFQFGTTPDKLNAEQAGQVKKQMAAEERAMVAKAIGGRQSPAQVVYEMAVATGYQPKTPEEIAALRAAAAAANGGAAPAVNGGAPAVVPPAANGAAPAAAAAVPDVGAEVDRIKAGQAAATTLSAGGGAPPATTSLESVLRMSDGDFAKMMEGGADDIRRLLGAPN